MCVERVIIRIRVGFKDFFQRTIKINKIAFFFVNYLSFTFLILTYLMESPANKSIDSRAFSPQRLSRSIDSSSEVYQKAMQKLIDASWKFDREKDSDLLKVPLI